MAQWSRGVSSSQLFDVRFRQTRSRLDKRYGDPTFFKLPGNFDTALLSTPGQALFSTLFPSFLSGGIYHILQVAIVFQTAFVSGAVFGTKFCNLGCFPELGGAILQLR